MIRILLFSLAAVCLSAQTMPGPGGPGIGMPNMIGPGVSPALQRYLELTQEQVQRITRLNNALRQFQFDKTRRVAQVQREIAEETRRPTLDPMALGLRHMELEAIRREVEAEQRKTMESIREVLTAAQRTRVTALQEVLRQYPMACEALNNNLMQPPPPPEATGVIRPDAGFATFLRGGGMPACAQFPNAIIRGGDFTFNPNPLP